MAAIDLGAVLLSEQEHGRQLRRAVLASTVGTAIEWYDFFLYSTVTGLMTDHTGRDLDGEYE